MDQGSYYKEPVISSHTCLSLLQMPSPVYYNMCLLFISLFWLNYIVQIHIWQNNLSSQLLIIINVSSQIMAKIKDRQQAPQPPHSDTWKVGHLEILSIRRFWSHLSNSEPSVTILWQVTLKERINLPTYCSFCKLWFISSQITAFTLV